MLTFLFWGLWALCVLAVFIPPEPSRPWLPRLNSIIILVMFGIVGYRIMKVALLLLFVLSMVDFLAVSPDARRC